jgi:EAL domain-containing protein (putative c-di-GMP-specific phosphodiesterase class I)
MSRLEGALPVLGELRRLGVALAIDDFGTGYSSLSHLSTLPIDCLKIDRSFVSRLASGANEMAVVRSIILLGSSLGKVVVAEGIETEDQLAQLREMGCRLGQGFLLARPQAAADVLPLLAARQTAGAGSRPTVAPGQTGSSELFLTSSITA